MRTQSRITLAAATLLVAVTACSGSGGGEHRAAVPTTTYSPTAESTRSRETTEQPFAYSTEPVDFESGVYRIPASEWSVRDFTVAFPDGWTVQYGHVYAKHPDSDQELGFYPVVVDAIYTDSCAGADVLMEVGPSVDDLAQALIQQPPFVASGPVQATLGIYPATRIDFAVPRSLDVEACRLDGIGLQIWYSPPADKYFVLLPNARASAYILEVGGQQQVFLAQYGTMASHDDLAELQASLDSIRIHP